MAWFDSFDDMVAADLRAFTEGEFSDAAIILRPACGGSYPLTCPLVVKGDTIDQESQHVSDKRQVQVLIPKVIKAGVLYQPGRGDVIEYDDQLWDYASCKGDEMGAVSVMFVAVEVSEFGRRPSHL
jgi:hypothetical protein